MDEQGRQPLEISIENENDIVITLDVHSEYDQGLVKERSNSQFMTSFRKLVNNKELTIWSKLSKKVSRLESVKEGSDWGFQFIDQGSVEKCMLDAGFKTKKFMSLKRQIHAYGFKTVEGKHGKGGLWHHPQCSPNGEGDSEIKRNSQGSIRQGRSICQWKQSGKLALNMNEIPEQTDAQKRQKSDVHQISETASPTRKTSNFLNTDSENAHTHPRVFGLYDSDEPVLHPIPGEYSLECENVYSSNASIIEGPQEAKQRQREIYACFDDQAQTLELNWLGCQSQHCVESENCSLAVDIESFFVRPLSPVKRPREISFDYNENFFIDRSNKICCLYDDLQHHEDNNCPKIQFSRIVFDPN